MPHLLLIDDNPAYCTQLAAEGRRYGFEVVYFHNLEDGFAALEASRKYKALVLDGHCMIEAGQGEPVKASFVFHALQKIDELEHTHNRIVPFCVNTEKPEDFTAELEGIAPVFEKSRQHDQLFAWLREAIRELPEVSIRLLYADVFEAVEYHFTEEEEEMLVDVLQLSGKSARADLVNGMATLRMLLELLMDIACRKHLGKTPDDFLNGHGSRTRRIIEALHHKVLPDELFKTATSLYSTCSQYGSHNERNLQHQSLMYTPGKYGYIRLLNTYLELVIFLFPKKIRNNI